MVKIENPSKLTLANLNQQGLRTNNYLQIRQQHPAIILIRGVGFIIPRTWSPASYQLSLLGFWLGWLIFSLIITFVTFVKFVADSQNWQNKPTKNLSVHHSTEHSTHIWWRYYIKNTYYGSNYSVLHAYKVDFKLQ